MTKPKYTPAQRQVERVIEIMGSPKAAADALGVSPVTVWRWRHGLRPVSLTAQHLATMIERHPADFAHLYSEPGTPGRPPKQEVTT